MKQPLAPSQPTSRELDDTVLVGLAKSGDFNAFEQLVRKYEGRVYGLVLRLVRRDEDAHDIVQQTFLSAMEHLDGFRGEARFSTWLFQIAVNNALKTLHQRKRPDSPGKEESDRWETLPTPDFVAPWSRNPEELSIQRETREFLDQAMATLDEKHRAVFVLRDVEGLSTEETAVALGISIANAKVRLLRARLALREHLTVLFGEKKNAIAGHHHEQKE